MQADRRNLRLFAQPVPSPRDACVRLGTNAYRASAIASTVIAFTLKDRTETQTDIAPSLISAVAMAPMVIDARKGMYMGPLWLEDGLQK